MVAQPEQPPPKVDIRVASWTETTAPTPERVETMSTRPQGGITTPPTRTQGLTTVMQEGTNYKYLRYLSILDPPNLGGIQGHAHRMMAIFLGQDQTMETRSLRTKTMSHTPKRGSTEVLQVGIT